MIVKNLILEEPGLHLGKHSERLRVTRIGSKERLLEAPLIHLESVLVASRGVSLSADAVLECAERGIPIHFLSSTGKPFACLYSAGLTGTVITRRQQMAAYNDERGAHLALSFARAKIENQAALLRYASRYRKESDPGLFAELDELAIEVLDHQAELDRLVEAAAAERLEGAPADDSGGSWAEKAGCPVDLLRPQLLSIEGRASQKYWKAVGKLLIPDINWPGRRTHGAADVFNSALNYGYGILYGAIERVCLLAGLDPYAGFLHVDRPGKPSLVLDLIEEFRQPVVDRTVIAYFNKGQALKLDEQGKITPESRRALAEKVIDRLNSRQKIEKESLAVQAIMQRQARAVAAYLRGERAHYSAYTFEW